MKTHQGFLLGALKKLLHVVGQRVDIGPQFIEATIQPTSVFNALFLERSNLCFVFSAHRLRAD